MQTTEGSVVAERCSPVGRLSDDELLSRYVARRDGDAFADLVRRHGPKVYAVCCRRLSNRRDADDAFQATFLVLVKRAESVRPRDRVGGWLCGVAWKVATRIGSNSRGRSEIPTAELADWPASGEPRAADDAEEVRVEVGRLPAIYRDAISLCYFSGLTYEQAADVAGCSRDAMANRVMVAKTKLRDRLVARGLGAVAVATLPQMLAPQSVPTALLAATASQAPVSAPVAATAAAVSQSMALSGLTKLVVAIVCLLGLAILPVVVPLGLFRSPDPTSEEVELVSNKLSVRPQLDGLDKREVPAVLGGALPGGHGSWSYDQSADVLTVTGNDKSSDLGVLVGKNGVFNETGEIQISAGENNTRTSFGEQGTINTKVFATGRTVIKVDGGKGDDAIRFTTSTFGIPAASVTQIGVARVELKGGDGNDLISHAPMGGYKNIANNNIAVPIIADGGAGNDKLDFAGTFFSGNDLVKGGAGGTLAATFTLRGGIGNDEILFDKRASSVEGGAGADRFIMATSTPVTLAQFQKLIPSNDYNTREDTFAGGGNKIGGFK